VVGQVTGGRPVFVLRVRAEPHVEGIRALRWLLKTMLRRFGLRCIEANQEIPQIAEMAEPKPPNTSATQGENS
jgi:hypothetical protein